MQLLYDSRVAPMRLRYSLHTSGIRPAYGWHTVDIRQFCVINQVRKSSSSFLCVSPRFFIMWITLHRVNAVFMIKNCKRRPSTRSDRKKYCWCPLHCRMHMKNILRTRACFLPSTGPPTVNSSKNKNNCRGPWTVDRGPWHYALLLLLLLLLITTLSSRLYTGWCNKKSRDFKWEDPKLFRMQFDDRLVTIDAVLLTACIVAFGFW